MPVNFLLIFFFVMTIFDFLKTVKSASGHHHLLRITCIISCQSISIDYAHFIYNQGRKILLFAKGLGLQLFISRKVFRGFIALVFSFINSSLDKLFISQPFIEKMNSKASSNALKKHAKVWVITKVHKWGISKQYMKANYAILEMVKCSNYLIKEW